MFAYAMIFAPAKYEVNRTCRSLDTSVCMLQFSHIHDTCLLFVCVCVRARCVCAYFDFLGTREFLMCVVL